MKELTIPAKDSRERLLESAETLFSQSGYNGVSVRDIAKAAGVNSALVGYYFGGKQGLLTEVYNRHAQPLTLERLRLLNEFRSSEQELSLEKVLEAFIRPSLEVTTDALGRSNFMRLRAILSGEDSDLLEQLVATNFDKSTRTFVKAIASFVPHLAIEEVFWRFHFLIGAINYTGTGPHRVYALTKGVCNPSDPVATTNQMIPFLAHGFRAPSVSPGKNRASGGKAPATGKKRTARKAVGS